MQKTIRHLNSFDKFTNLYSLSKTLRFELKPVGKTLDNMKKDLQWDERLQTFFKDQEIEDAYQTLKPEIDKIHEQFITESLESEDVNSIGFSSYLEQYKNKKILGEKTMELVEIQLRDKIRDLFVYTSERWKKEKYSFLEWKIGGKIASGFFILSSSDVLKLIKKIRPEDVLIRKAADKMLGGFLTYLSGFNQNRENYYETKKEASTAVATRIINENLPKFCDNIISFENREEEYLDARDFLKKKNIELIDKEGGKLVDITKKIFKIDYFSQCFSQIQIEDYNNQIGNANFIINLYNQIRKSDAEFKILPLFKTLYKQIGCGKRDALFFEIKFERKEGNEIKNRGISLEEVLEKVSDAGKKYFQTTGLEKSINNVPELLDYLAKKENYLGVYWSKAAINTISNKYFANWHELRDKLKSANIFQNAARGSEEDVKIPEAIELEGFFNVLDGIENWKNSFFKESIFRDGEKKKIVENSDKPSKALIKMIFLDIKSYCDQFLKNSTTVLNLKNYDSEVAKDKIKTWLDDALSICQILKYFQIKENKVKGEAVDSIVSEALDAILRSDDAQWYKWYDGIRNFLTKKPQDDAKVNKLKLNFDNGNLLGGWSDGQEKTKASVLLRRDGIFYLGILKKKSIFDTEKENSKMYATVNKNAERLILSNLKFQTLAGKGYIRDFKINYSQDPNAIKNLQTLIKKQYIKNYPSLKLVADKTYTEKKIFDKDIKEALLNCYLCKFIPINWAKVEEYTNIGDMYLFKINSKDIIRKAGGNKDLQTLYWNSLFDVDSPFQLNGGGEIFYRKQAIKNKKVKDGYGKKPFVIESKRFTEEKFLFHCPIKLNYRAKSYSKPLYALSEINNKINEYFVANDNIRFLGIDRGEKHLIYYSLIDKDGKILDQGTLNIIEGHDYQAKLDVLEKSRQKARKSWQTIGTIKEFKEGYISQVVRRIADIAVQNNALIVLEDLNTGFKRGRQKIEKSIYQKFELALAKKLNFLVDKAAANGEIGFVTKALQLVPPVNNFGDIERKKQVGIMLYTRANYTSTTDPSTGWRKKIYLKKGSEESIKEQITESFTDIGLDGKDYFFEYIDKNIGKQWRLYSGKNGNSLDRFRGTKSYDKNEWNVTKVDVGKILKTLFEGFDKNESFLSQIMNKNASLNKIEDNALNPNKTTAWESLRFAIDIMQQIRNVGKAEEDNDFILSPVRDQKGNHFDSRLVAERQPVSGDSNGAYNIARKGIIMYEHIKHGFKLFISDAEWDAWLAGKNRWEKWLANSDNQKMLTT